MRVTLATAIALSAGAMSNPALAQQPVTTYTWVCNIGGAPAQLTAAVQPVGANDVTPSPLRVIPLNDVNYFYQGTLVSASARYAFTGTNGFANFVDLIGGERFPVQFVAQGPLMAMIINPQDPRPVQYLCQMTGG